MAAVIDIHTINRIHFIGVGGIGMSALARLFLYDRKKVSGSDSTRTPLIDELEKEGVHMFSAQESGNIQTDIDLVVYTEALPKDHAELAEAKKRGIPTLNYFEALGVVANQYYLIAVSGTHGKTTTTAMLTDILEEAGLDPTAIIGSLRQKTGSNFRSGKSKYMAVEACEYRRNFLALTPDILVITNIEHDHVDYFRDVEDVQKAFRELVGQVREDGVVVLNKSDANSKDVLNAYSGEVVDYSKYMNPLLPLKQPGIHNALNAAAASAAAQKLGVPPESCAAVLAHFEGTWRRFEYKGELNGAPVYDDYGHHPTEITATVKATRDLYPDKEVLLVFQPHTYSRTEKLFDDFVEALSLADKIFVLPIYAARKESGSSVSHEKIVNELLKMEKAADTLNSFEEAQKVLEKAVTKDDVVLIMGAGDVTNLATTLTHSLHATL